MTSSNPTSPSVELVSTIQITRAEPEKRGPSPLTDSRPQSTPPPEVTTQNQSGVEDGALKLAKQFMAKMGNLARKCHSRGALSELYLTTQSAWVSPEVLADESLQRHFKQVLFAIAHGMKLVRVRDQGRSLFWNRYRDNEGNQLDDERAKYSDRQQDQQGGGDQRNYRDDRRGADRRDDRRGDQRGADRRDDRRDDRRGGGGDRRGGGGGDQRNYRDDRRGGTPRSTEPDSKGWITVGGNSRSHHRGV